MVLAVGVPVVMSRCKATVSLNNVLYVMGGVTGSTFLNDVWYTTDLSKSSLSPLRLGLTVVSGLILVS